MEATAYRTMTNSQASLLAGALGAAETLGRLIRLWRARIAERRTLAAFELRDLHDVGMSHWDAEHERAKPFWRG